MTLAETLERVASERHDGGAMLVSSPAEGLRTLAAGLVEFLRSTESRSRHPALASLSAEMLRLATVAANPETVTDDLSFRLSLGLRFGATIADARASLKEATSSKDAVVTRDHVVSQFALTTLAVLADEIRATPGIDAVDAEDLGAIVVVILDICHACMAWASMGGVPS